VIDKLPSYVVEQNRIDLYQNTMRVMALMVQHQSRTDISTFVDGMRWTAETIGTQIPDINKTKIKAALKWLVDNLFIEKRGEEWFVKPEGIDAFREEMTTTSIATGSIIQAFRDEALTGCDDRGKQSSLSKVALPEIGHHHGNANKPENKMIRHCLIMDKIRKLAIKYGQTIDKTTSEIVEGVIHQCNQCGQYKRHHKDNSKNGWQSACIDCRKSQR